VGSLKLDYRNSSTGSGIVGIKILRINISQYKSTQNISVMFLFDLQMITLQRFRKATFIAKLNLRKRGVLPGPSFSGLEVIRIIPKFIRKIAGSG
jgi:hypothetical protein